MQTNTHSSTISHSKKTACLLLCLVFLAASIPLSPVRTDAAVAWPSFSKSKPVRAYTVSAAKNYPVYDSKHKVKKNRWIHASDKVYIQKIKNGWATVKYPYHKKQKTGYVPLSTFTSASTPQSRKTAQVTLSVYRRSTGKDTTETVKKGVSVYTMTTSGSRVQILYQLKSSSGKDRGWQLGWVDRADYNRLTANKNDSTLRITGVAKPSTLTQGTPFTVTGTVSSNYRIRSVTVSVVNAKKQVVTSRTAYPNTYSFNLSSLDNYILFDRAPVGVNYYRIVASDGKKTASFNAAYTVSKSSGSLKPFNRAPGGDAYFKGYAGYSGVNYRSQTSDSRRIKALDKAKKMVTVRWVCAGTFPSWYNSEGYYSTTKSTDGTVSDRFLKGKTYVGIPYSMYNHSYDDNAWKKLVKSGYSWNDIARPYYSRTKLTTAKGSDCSYFVYLCMRAGGANVTYQTTYTMYNGKYYKKISKSSLKPGDILLSYHHVRLYAGRVGSRYAVFESTTDGSSTTRYKLFTAAELASYEAYRYKKW